MLLGEYSTIVVLPVILVLVVSCMLTGMSHVFLLASVFGVGVAVLVYLIGVASVSTEYMWYAV